MNNAICSLTLIPFLAACGADDPGRAPAKVAEIETTVQRGSTTIERLAISYDGSHIREVSAYVNGAPAGRTTMMYSGDAIQRIDVADAEGDRGQHQLTYEGGRLVRTRYDVTGVLTEDRTLRYEADRIKEIAETRTLAGGSPMTTLTRVEYDTAGRTAKQTVVRGSSTDATELRYAADGRLERATKFHDNAHVETYSLVYDADGRLEEVTDSQNGRHSISYDADGRVAEIRWLAASSTTTTRYTYVEGELAGMTFAPALPVSDLFDLGGSAHTTISPLHWVPEVPGDIARAAGGGGGGGEEGETCGFTPENACDQCLVANCCAETEACLPGTACYQFYECASPCTTQTCVNTCREINPSGAAALDSLRTCGQAYCPTTCQ